VSPRADLLPCSRRFEAKTGKRVIELRIEDVPGVLTHAGFVETDGTEVVKILKINRL